MSATATRGVLRIADDLRLPLDAVTETLGIFGQKGSGKSSTSAVFVEQGVGAGGRFVIADPTGVWWGLMHDGLGPGLPGIVFGGEHADVPLEATGGRVVAEFVVQQDEYPVVVLDMKLMRKADRTRFMLAFLETLYHENREALHVVLDESHQFAPTQAREGGDQIRLLGAVEDVVALGRARGLGITMISQRFATLNANVREQIGTLVAHRLIGSLDRKALKGWIEAQADPAREREVMDVMAKLKTAQALVWSPAFLDFFGVVNVAAPTTFDSRATPKVGQRVKNPGRRAPVDLAVLRERMAATIEEAERNDPKKLRAQLAEARAATARLQREIEAHVCAAPAETIEVPVLTPETTAALGEYLQQLKEGHASVADAYERLREVLGPLDYNVLQALKERDFPVVKASPPVRPQPREAKERGEQRDPVGSSPGLDAPPGGEHLPSSALGGIGDGATQGPDSLRNPEQRVLDALAWYEALGIHDVTRVQAGVIAGYSHTSGGFKNILSRLRSQYGMIAYPQEGALALTDSGRAHARDPEIERTNEGVQHAVKARLSGPQLRVLEPVLVAYPAPVTRAQIADAAGYEQTSGGFKNLLSSLRTMRLIDYPSPGEVVATSLLFPLG